MRFVRLLLWFLSGCVRAAVMLFVFVCISLLLSWGFLFFLLFSSVWISLFPALSVFHVFDLGCLGRPSTRPPRNTGLAQVQRTPSEMTFVFFFLFDSFFLFCVDQSFSCSFRVLCFLFSVLSVGAWGSRLKTVRPGVTRAFEFTVHPSTRPTGNAGLAQDD
jgi:hypothetical protein